MDKKKQRLPQTGVVMKGLPNSGTDTTCIKCGNRCHFKVEYRPEVEFSNPFQSGIWNEHLKITCRRCDYSWDEECLDSEIDERQEEKNDERTG